MSLVKSYLFSNIDSFKINLLYILATSQTFQIIFETHSYEKSNEIHNSVKIY